jgi:hypothetical protein
MKRRRKRGVGKEDITALALADVGGAGKHSRI